MRRARFAGLLACLLAAPAGGCAAREEPVTQPDFETRLVLKNAAGEEASAFRSGETITLVVTIRNRAAAPRSLTFSSSQTHDCFIYAAAPKDAGVPKDAGGDSGGDAGGRREVWRHSAGRMFAQVITDLTLAPGESRSFTATWNQTDAKGKPVPPGRYEAVGLVAGRAPGCRSDSVSFTISL